MRFTKKDIIASLVIGETIFWLIVFVTKNLNVEIPIFFIWPIIFPLLGFCAVFIAYALGEKIPIIYQVVKFVLVGALNTFIDFGVLNLLILLSGTAIGLPYTIFKGLSFTVAVVNSYFWNKFWTFSVANTAKPEIEVQGREFLTFLIVSVIGFVINVGMASLIVNVMGSFLPVSSKLLANIGAGTAVIFSMIWNFIGYKFFVFKR